MKKLVLCLLMVAGWLACGGMRRTPAVDVILHSDRPDMEKASLLVFRFREPSEAAGKGVLLAQYSQEILLQRRLFRVISPNTDTPWERLGESEEQRLLQALAVGVERGYDYILVGEVGQYVYGGLQASRVELKVRLIETRSRATVFFARHMLQAAAREASYPMDTQMSEYSLHPDRLARRVLTELLARL